MVAGRSPFHISIDSWDRRNMEEKMEEHYERYRRVIADLTMMSDIFMRNVLKQPYCVQEVLRIILGEEDLIVEDVVIQRDYKNLQGRSATLDCVATDQRKRQFDVEVQQKDGGALPERARYHAGLLDMNTLMEGQDFLELPESYVIFITLNDVLREKRPICFIKRIVEETNHTFEDRTRIIYINSKIQDDTPLGRLMHDFHCRRAEDMYNVVLADRVRVLKETKEGVKEMCEQMDAIYRWGEADGRKQGEEIGRRQGEAQMNVLITYMLRDGRVEELQRSAHDRTFQEQLFAEYGLEGER